jgi:hypothetical protein
MVNPPKTRTEMAENPMPKTFLFLTALMVAHRHRTLITAVIRMKNMDVNLLTINNSATISFFYKLPTTDS